jgi:hypothetical protein
LKKEEFRVACLSAVPKPDYPLHLTLEIFADHDHPEYECASYSWGGEEGDSSLCQPVYIGDHWDILLQTRNCWSMLCFLRPKRGIRTVWVDAVCINQENTDERGAQVTKMRTIYENCSRVFVYLGEDLVTVSEHYPTWQPLNAIEDVNPHVTSVTSHRLRNENYGIRDLLSLRYFSRVWVIQELVVSEQVVIRVGNVNFRANARIIDDIRSIEGEPDAILGQSLNDVSPQDITHFSKSTARLQWQEPSTSPRLAHEEMSQAPENYERMLPDKASWSATSAPWVQHLAHKIFPPSDIKDVSSLLKLTAKSSASDPRDRLFGVISLLGIPEFQKNLGPDYSLSFLHFSIGLFAHLLITEGRSWFLGKAGVGRSAQDSIEHGLPSWVPRCRSETLWQDMLVYAPEKASQLRFKEPSWPPFPLYLEQNNKKIAWNGRVYLEASDRFPTTVDSATGALSISAAHILQFEGGILLERNHGPIFIYRVQRRVRNRKLVPSRLLLVTLGKVDILPDRDHLYIPVSMPKVYLVLRRCINSSNPSSFELVTSCLRLFDQERSPIRPTDLDFLAQEENQDPETWSRVGSVPEILIMQSSLRVQIEDIRRIIVFWTTNPTTLADPIDETKEPDFESFHLWSIWPLDPARALHIPDVLPVVLQLCLAIHDDEDEREDSEGLSRGNHLESTYLACINKSFIHKIEKTDNKTYVHLAVNMVHWTKRRYEDTFGRLDDRLGQSNVEDKEDCTGLRWTWRYTDEAIWREPSTMLAEIMKAEDQSPSSTELPNKYVIVRTRLESLLQNLRDFLKEFATISRRLFTAFHGPPDFEILARMIRSNPFKDFESFELGDSVGLGYYMGDVRIDGRVSLVHIV